MKEPAPMCRRAHLFEFRERFQLGTVLYSSTTSTLGMRTKIVHWNAFLHVEDESFGWVMCSFSDAFVPGSIKIFAYPNHMAGILSTTAYGKHHLRTIWLARFSWLMHWLFIGISAQERHTPYVINLPGDLKRKRSHEGSWQLCLCSTSDYQNQIAIFH